MINDSKFVKSVNSNAPKKGWKIQWQDDKYDNIFDESWLPILDEAQKTNRLVAFKKEKNQAGYWNIVSLELATETPEPVKPASTHTPTDKPEPAPQAVGMTTKEIGDMIRAGKLKEIFGFEIAVDLIKWYRGQILATTRINFDGEKLPQFTTHQSSTIFNQREGK